MTRLETLELIIARAQLAAAALRAHGASDLHTQRLRRLARRLGVEQAHSSDRLVHALLNAAHGDLEVDFTDTDTNGLVYITGALDIRKLAEYMTW